MQQSNHRVYCWRVGDVYFSSRVHSWAVRLMNGWVDRRKAIPRRRLSERFEEWSSYAEEVVVIDDNLYQDDDDLISSAATDSCVEVGVIDCEELHAVSATSKNNWVCRKSVTCRMLFSF